MWIWIWIWIWISLSDPVAARGTPRRGPGRREGAWRGLAGYQRQRDSGTADGRAHAVAGRRRRQAFRWRRAVEGRALAQRAAERGDHGLHVADGLVGALLGAGHAADRLLHQGAADVVGAAAQHVPAELAAQLHPGALDVADGTMQHQPRQRVD